MWFLVNTQTLIPTNQTFLLEKMRERFCYYFHKLVHALPQWNNYLFISHFWLTLLFYYSVCEISTWSTKPGAALPDPFFPSPSSSFTFSSVSPYPFWTLCHRQSYNNLMFECGRNIEFWYSCLMYLTFEIILLSVISESWINMNTTTTQKITIFSFNRNLYLVRVFFNLACLWNRDFLKELSVGNIYNRSLADALTL